MVEIIVVSILGWMAAPLFSKLFEKAFDLLGRSRSDRREILEATVLPRLVLAIEKAEKSPNKDQLQAWLRRLKDAYYKAEEAIELLEYGGKTQRRLSLQSMKRLLVRKIMLKGRIDKIVEIAKEVDAFRDLLEAHENARPSTSNPDTETIACHPATILGRNIETNAILMQTPLISKRGVVEHRLNPIEQSIAGLDQSIQQLIQAIKETKNGPYKETLLKGPTARSVVQEEPKGGIAELDVATENNSTEALIFENTPDSQAIEDEFKRCVIMQTSHEFPKERVESYLKESDPTFPWRVMEVADYRFLVEGPEWWRDEVTRQEVTKIDSVNLRTYPWNTTSYENGARLKSLWVRIVGFPRKFWYLQGFEKLVAGFGVVLQIDTDTVTNSNLREAKLLIGVCKSENVPETKLVIYRNERNEFCWSMVRFLIDMPIEQREEHHKRKRVWVGNSDQSGLLEGDNTSKKAKVLLKETNGDQAGIEHSGVRSDQELQV